MNARSRFHGASRWWKVLLIAGIIGGSAVLLYHVYPYLEKEAGYDITLSTPLHAVSDVPIGVAVDVNKLRHNGAYRTIVETHFNSLTAENHMKWMFIQPERDIFTFENANYIVEFAENHSMGMHGHCLVWHEQLPRWIHEFQGTPVEWNATLKTHVQALVSQFAGRVSTWDVVNEAFTRDGFRETIWYQHLGPDYIKHAFTWAHEADPGAVLYYNDYGLLSDHAKLDVVLTHLAALIADGVPVHGIGCQGHISLWDPSVDRINEAISRIEALGVALRISELDMQVNRHDYHVKYTEQIAAAQCQRYPEVTRAFCQSPALTGITLWGVSDADSWIPGFTGRREWPLLFDQAYQAKPAAKCFQDALQEMYA